MDKASTVRSKQFHEHFGKDFSYFFHGIPCGAALHRFVFNDEGEIIDYITLDVNTAFEEKMKLRRSQIVLQPASGRMSPDELQHWLLLLSPVVQQNEHIHFDMYDKQGRRYKAFATSPGKDLFLILFSLSEGHREESRVMTVMRESYSVLSDLYLRILQAHSVRSDLETGIVLERVCKSLDLDFGGIWIPDRFGDTRLLQHYFRDRELNSENLHCYPRLFPCVMEKINKGSGSFFVSREMVQQHRCQDIRVLDILDARYLFFSGLCVPSSKQPGLICFTSSYDNSLFGYTTKGYLDLIVLYLQSLLARYVNSRDS